MRRTTLTLLAAACFTALPAPADAQVAMGGSRPRAGAVEVSGGGLWTGGQTLPASAAVLTGNPAAGNSAFQLFSSDPELGPAVGVQVSAGVYVTPAFAIEGGLQVSRPELTVALSDDVEGAADVTATTRLTSYLFTGSLVYHFSPAGRYVPFVAGGAGHIRDVHPGNEVVETGLEYHGRAGMKVWFGARRAAGLRLEGGISLRDGGFSYDEERRVVPSAAASFLYLF